MKLILLMVVTLGISAGVGYALLRAAGRQPYLHEMELALALALLGGIAALALPLLQRQFGQASVIQASFYGTIAHLAICFFLAVALFILCGIHGAEIQPYALWVMWFFWVSLAAVAGSLIRLIRATPLAPAQLSKQ